MTGCPPGGQGDPCIPEDEYTTSFSGYDEDEVQVAASIEDDELVLVASAGDDVLGTVTVDDEPPVELPGVADAFGWLFGASSR